MAAEGQRGRGAEGQRGKTNNSDADGFDIKVESPPES